MALLRPLALTALAGALAAPAAVAVAGDPPPPTVAERAPAPARMPVLCAPASTPPATAAPPSRALLDAFGVLRRAPEARDALPARALEALRLRGLAPADPGSARLLRTTAQGGRAWVVPVADAGRGLAPPACAAPAPRRGGRGAPPRPAPAPVLPAPRTDAAPAPAAPETGPAPEARPAPAPTTPAPPPAPARPAPAPTTPAPAPAPARGPREGLAVVALGGAPAGGGGARVDLVRGRAPVAVEPCGPDGLVAISGIVPDGVATAFLVGRDGSAVRADVRDNGFAFLVRPERRRRWVVWTDPSGVPRVQPVALPAAPCPRRGAPAGLGGPPRVTPAPACLAAPPRPPRRPGRRGAPTPAPVAPSCGVLLQPLAP